MCQTELCAAEDVSRLIIESSNREKRAREFEKVDRLRKKDWRSGRLRVKVLLREVGRERCVVGRICGRKADDLHIAPHQRVVEAVNESSGSTAAEEAVFCVETRETEVAVMSCHNDRRPRKPRGRNGGCRVGWMPPVAVGLGPVSGQEADEAE